MTHEIKAITINLFLSIKLQESNTRERERKRGGGITMHSSRRRRRRRHFRSAFARTLPKQVRNELYVTGKQHAPNVYVALTFCGT